MDFDIARIISIASIAALPVIFAITLHEAAHGYAARHFGDPTAYKLGRISLNPLRHIDPVGTIALPLISLATGAPLFGWAKPVPVNFSQLRRPRQDMIWVAAAGPFANFLMILFWMLIIKLAFLLPANAYQEPMALMGKIGVSINAVLMVLNLVPLPPLDGGRIAVGLLPRELAVPLARVEPFGLIILVVLLVSGVLGKVIGPIVDGTIALATALLGV